MTKRVIRQAAGLLRDLWSEWNRDNVPRQSAAIAYYTVFSLPSFLLIVITVAAVIIGRETVETEMFRQLGESLGSQTAETLRTTVNGIQTTKASALMTAVGIGALLLGATGVFRELQTSLNQILRVSEMHGKKRKYAGLITTLLSYILSFSLLLAAGFLLLVSLTLSALLTVLSRSATPYLPLPVGILGLGETLISAVIIVILFALLYRFLPARRFPWRSILAGAVTSTVLFLLSKAILGIYLGRAGIGSQYGIAASILILLLWIYWTSMIFLTGAEVIDQCEQRNLLSGKPKG
jgi:membrane protein